MGVHQDQPRPQGGHGGLDESGKIYNVNVTLLNPYLLKYLKTRLFPFTNIEGIK